MIWCIVISLFIVAMGNVMKFLTKEQPDSDVARLDIYLFLYFFSPAWGNHVGTPLIYHLL